MTSIKAYLFLILILAVLLISGCADASVEDSVSSPAEVASEATSPETSPATSEESSETTPEETTSEITTTEAATSEATTETTTEATTSETTTAVVTSETTAATTAETTTATTTTTTTAATTTAAVPDETTEPALSYTLSNPDADENARRLYEYICSTYKTAIITCQQESTWMGSPEYEMNYILNTTGKLPAMRGLDFMNADFDGVVRRAKQWQERGGIVTICWHTGINGLGYQESLGDVPDFDKLLTEGTDEYNAMIANWDRAAAALAELRDAGIPVLWRPFHEFDGGWFWWGKGGGDNFIKLWRMMYDRYTNEFGLDNLIWVLGYSGEVKNGWYPGDDYCDIIGSDTYDNTTNARAWARLEAMDTGKPLAFHECGNVPSIEDFYEDGAVWSWFMIWHTTYITDNDKDNLIAVYNHEDAITLDELPDLYAG